MAKHRCNCKDATIVEGIFGEIYREEEAPQFIPSNYYGGQGDEIQSIKSIPIKSYIMTNTNRMEVVLISWGATIVSIKCPDKYGQPADVVLGFDNLESYMNPNLNPFIGCILGRCANRIKNGCCSIKDNDCQLTINDEKHHLHGGNCGFGKRVWDSQIDGCTVVMSYLSADSEEGYPGAVLATVRFKLTVDNKLEIGMRATTSKPTVLNLSHGSFFNLAGHDAGEEELKNHSVALNCDRWTFADYVDPIPTGSIRGVGGTVMDLRIPRVLGECINKVPPGEGYDHNFCVIRSWQPGVAFVGRIVHPQSGRVLEVYSDQPGVQFYTGGRLPMQIHEDFTSSETLDAKKYDDLASYASFANEAKEDEEEDPWEAKELQSDTEPLIVPLKKHLEFIAGKNGARYTKFGAFSIQPQNYPNAVNIKHFPSSILRPGQIYSHDLTYKFGVQLSNSM